MESMLGTSLRENNGQSQTLSGHVDRTKAGEASCPQELRTEQPRPPQPGPCSVAPPAGEGQAHQLTNWGNSSKNMLGGMSHLSNVNW